MGTMRRGLHLRGRAIEDGAALITSILVPLSSEKAQNKNQRKKEDMILWKTLILWKTQWQTWPS
jgi:hypothetical protein